MEKKKKKSAATPPRQTHLFFSFRVQESVLAIFSHVLSFHILRVPQQGFLLLSSELPPPPPPPILKDPQDQEIVSYM